MRHPSLALRVVLRFILPGVLAVSSTSLTHAQTSESSGSVSEWMVGVDGSYGRVTQHGSFDSPCGCEATDGSGSGYSAGAFARLSVSTLFTIGFKVAATGSHTRAVKLVNEQAVIQTEPASMDTITKLPINRIAEFAVSDVGLMPFVELHPVQGYPFLRISPTISFVTSTNTRTTRELVSQSVTLPGGEVITPVRFTNGTSSEPVEDEAIPDAKSTLYSVEFGVGWDVVVWGLTLSPMVDYRLPITTITDTHVTDLRFPSISGSLAVSFALPSGS